MPWITPSILESFDFSAEPTASFQLPIPFSSIFSVDYPQFCAIEHCTIFSFSGKLVCSWLHAF
jgi:hypothetical protein